LRSANTVSLTSPGVDLSTKLRVFQRELRARAESRDALLDIVRAVNSTLDPDRIAELVIDRAAAWIPAQIWAVVCSDLSGAISTLANRGLTQEMGPAATAIASWVMDRDQEFFSPSFRDDSRLHDPSIGAVVAFPLTCRGRRVGAIVALDRLSATRAPRLSPSLFSALRLLFEPVAAALDNAQLFKRVEALSVTDDLTRLYNSRYLNSVLHRETKRASRNGRPLSLLFIDLDGFKGVNDAHGHLCGSRALVEAAAVIRGSARETDVVARFGGDEFALILPDTGGEGAFAVGERIRERIAAHIFLDAEGLGTRLTCSVGVATLPDSASSADEIIQAADRAMYAVKASGKNGIQAAGPADN
jgi:diguanylate cyclase (GGDEF)-like protein